MRVAVLGAGGVGGFLAAALTRSANDVIVIARDATVEAVAREGLTVTSTTHGQMHERPRAATALDDEVDALIVTVKATGLADALAQIHTDPPLVVPQLNGLDHMPVLRERFGDAVVAAAIRIEATRVGPTTIEHTSPFLLVDMAGAPPQLVAVLDAAGIPTRTSETETQVMWTKLVRLNALALTTTAFEAPLGAIRDDPDRRAALVAVMHETAAAGNAAGARLDPGIAETELLVNAHDGLRSSMSRDVEAGREPELDAIAGSVLRAAARHDVDVPTIASLTRLISRRAGVEIHA
jgi:2-dehydropantoate 2-reductase